MTIEEVATLLCKGPAPDWAITRLRESAALVGADVEHQDDAIDRRLLDAALQLQQWLPLSLIPVYKALPVCNGLEPLIDILARNIDLPRRGPKLDLSRHRCAAVCAWIWCEVHGHTHRIAQNCGKPARLIGLPVVARQAQAATSKAGKIICSRTLRTL